MTKDLRTSSGCHCSVEELYTREIHQLDDGKVHSHGLSLPLPVQTWFYITGKEGMMPLVC